MPIRVLLLIAAFLAWPAFAQTSADTRKELGATLDALKQSNQRQRHLKERSETLEREMRHLQEEMVSLGRESQDDEEALSGAEEKLAILETQKRQKAQELARRQAELETMLSAMVNLRELPPEAVIAMPGKLDETLATARALGLVTHAITEETESLRGQLRELDELEVKIRERRETIARKKTSLAMSQKELNEKVKQRSELEDVLGGQAREESERMAHLMAKSQSLQDLLDSLGKVERRQNEEQEAVSHAARKHPAQNPHHTLRPFASAKGELHLPAAGKIVSRYGNTATGASYSKGIVIDTREGAGVNAPFDGEVVFAGTFRGYGRMVILRHSDDYHTLLSGMDAIHCTPGQFLLEGEPIGAMGNRSDGNHLYMELRKSGKPIDPLPWIRG